jgi:hypothetical protein
LLTCLALLAVAALTSMPYRTTWNFIIPPNIAAALLLMLTLIVSTILAALRGNR